MQHIVAGNPYHAIAVPGEKIIPHAIPLPSAFGKVLGAVDFQDQSQLDTAEVGRIRGNRILAAKLLLADLPVANPLPDSARELVGRGATANGRTRWRQAILRGFASFRPSPPTPLPEAGRGEIISCRSGDR
jgi:hypothetical protein